MVYLLDLIVPLVHIAKRMLFLAVARVLWGFRIEAAAVDPDSGHPVVPDPLELTLGALVQPVPFPARISPRAEKRAQIIRDRWAADLELLDGDGQWKEIPEGMKFHTYEPAKE
ncbi:putative cytochrome p450 protein [Eutypa lata UCREL1]|uniref:Putative cytochrome p450 protein n=1 Tax=Eutypa lata (strain UCR-EL1) TaxID=1287681 RepID=M7T4J2_EUTLA|nr:putative cytochrome p450 protein [Eutypa lata UCREL1]